MTAGPESRLPWGSSGCFAHSVADAHEESWNGNVFVQFIPVQTGSAAAHRVASTLLGRGLKQAGEIPQRNAKLAAGRAVSGQPLALFPSRCFQ